MKLPLFYAVLTACFWGLYGHALAQSRTTLGSPFKPYVMIGVAYLVLGVGGGLLGMLWKGDTFAFTGAGSLWGFLAGALGAFGALALTWAMFTGGARTPHTIMAIVFGGAVTVAALWAVRRADALAAASPWLWVGMLAIAVGAALVAYHTPHEAPRVAGTLNAAAARR